MGSTYLVTVADAHMSLAVHVDARVTVSPYRRYPVFELAEGVS